jgi:hypothetical protein
MSACRVLDFKLRNTAKSLKKWSQKYVRSVQLQLVVAKEVVFKLDQAQESRPLSSEEVLLRNELKMKCLSLASLCRSIARQQSRLTFLREGDANTAFFHLQACHRNRKNTIMHIEHNGTMIVDEELKAEAIFDHFDQIMGAMVEHTNGINLDCISLSRDQVPLLDHCFTEKKSRV